MAVPNQHQTGVRRRLTFSESDENRSDHSTVDQAKAEIRNLAADCPYLRDPQWILKPWLDAPEFYRRVPRLSLPAVHRLRLDVDMLQSRQKPASGAPGISAVDTPHDRSAS